MPPLPGLPGLACPVTSVRPHVSVSTQELNLLTVFLSVSDFTVESYGLMASSAVTGQSFARGTLVDIELTCIVLIFTPPETLCGVLCLVSVQFYENRKYL